MPNVEIPSGYIRYYSLGDVINRRESFVSCMRRYHREPHIESMERFNPTAELDKLAERLQLTVGEEDKDIKQLLTIYKRTLRPVAAKLYALSTKTRMSCINTLDLNCIWHNDNGVVLVDKSITPQFNDFAWDYASLLARTSDGVNYISILHNNRLVAEVTNQYQDSRAAIRITMSMVLIDLMDAFTLLINQKEGVELPVPGNTLRTLPVLQRRIIFLTGQCYTTVDYFNYVYQ